MKKTVIVLLAALILCAGCINFFDEDIRPNREEYDIVWETNRVRTNPRGYAAELKAILDTTGANWSATNRAPYIEAIEDLESTPVLNALKLDYGMFRAARDHAQDMINNSEVRHIGSDGTEPTDRAQRYGRYPGVGENVARGYRTSEAVVLAWVLSTGHRNNMLTSGWTLIGPAHLPRHPGSWVSVQKFTARRN